MGSVALIVGESLAPNLVQFLDSLEKLQTDHEFTVVGTGIDTSAIPSEFEYHDVQGTTADRGITSMLATYRRTVSYLRTNRPDAVWQITSPKFHALPVMAAAQLAKVPVATRLPGDMFDEYRKASNRIDASKLFILNNFGLRTVRFSSLVVTLSEANRECLIQRGIQDNKIRVLRPPLNTDRFAPPDPGIRERLQKELGFDINARCILYVGRLTELKGMPALKTVLASLTDETGYEFHFVGDGPFREQLESFDNTVVHGVVAPSDVHRYYKAADLHVHPSHLEEEGISWTMLEAAATGLPVVARDIGDADKVASTVFDEPMELLDYFSDPSLWEPATYPSEWALESLKPAYQMFLDELVEG